MTWHAVGSPGHVHQILRFRAGDIPVPSTRRARGDLGVDIGHVLRRNRLYGGTWVVVPALDGKPGRYSFDSSRKAGHYLTHKDLRVRMAASDDTCSSARTPSGAPRRA